MRGVWMDLHQPDREEENAAMFGGSGNLELIVFEDTKTSVVRNGWCF